jgi:hypothetical protein
MKLSSVFASVTMVAVMGGFTVVSMAQRAANGPTTPPANGEPTLSLPVPTQATHEELRYQFSPHQFGANNVLQEIYIKLDCYTGKTWRFHASTARWNPIPEPEAASPLESSEQNRYQLLTHDYYDTYGEEQELIMRVDGVSGSTWTYRGANGGWKQIEQEN